MDAPPLSEQELTEVYNWVDQIPLSRPKKNITRDFSDGGTPPLTKCCSPKSSPTTSPNWWNSITTSALPRRPPSSPTGTLSTVPPPPLRKSPEETQLPGEQKRHRAHHHSHARHHRTRAEGDPQQDQSVRGQEAERGRPEGVAAEGAGVPPGEQEQRAEGSAEREGLGDQGAEEHGGSTTNLMQILQLKIQKMEQLIKIKDSKIQSLVSKLQQAGLA